MNDTAPPARIIIPSWARAPRWMAKPAPPNDLQRAALLSIRDGGRLTLKRGRAFGVWTTVWESDSGDSHLMAVVSACRRRGWLTDAPGYERAFNPSWTPVVITDAGLVMLGKGE